MDTLRSRLTYTPRELKFGTSGRRGEVVHLTDLEIYINVLAEIEYLQTLASGDGGVERGDEFFAAFDLRPSSVNLFRAVLRAVRDGGMRPVNLGAIPTPALTCYALLQGKGSIMVTGSHIPFDRNGYKLNTSRGELLKQHEAPINQAVSRVRQRIYDAPFDVSLFDEQGRFKFPELNVPPESDVARSVYIRRYTDFFDGLSLKGTGLLVYQHSAVGRDLLVDVLRSFGAEVTPTGRSDSFVPIDTENIDAAQLTAIQNLVSGPAAAVVSVDGDSDRPLVLGVDSTTSQVQFYGGDLVGMIVAEFLGADAVVVPISCNDAIDRGELAGKLEPKTRIGSPYVIEGMETARMKGRKAVCGWEANGGFLTGSEFRRGEAVLKALPTRDAFLPILCVLFAARERGVSLNQLFAALPKRFSRAALLKNFPRETSLKIVERYSAAGSAEKLSQVLHAAIERIDYTDGVRVIFDNGEVVHFRPSGNADEFRVYAVADTQKRADALAALGIQEPDGLLRELERSL